MKNIALISLTILFLNVHLTSQESRDHIQNPLDLAVYYQELLTARQGDLRNMKGTGYMPFHRNMEFYKQRWKADSLGEGRLALFKKAIANRINYRNGVPTAKWKSLGPHSMETYGGRIISHAFDPVDENRIWVGAASGGLWVSENRGESWEPKSDAIPSVGIGAIAIQPLTGQRIVIGTGEGYSPTGIVIKPGIGIFTSDDDGETWQASSFAYNLQAAVSILDFEWHPTDHNVIWAAATNGLWKSVDQGETWTLIMGDGTNHQNFIIDDVIIRPDNPEVMFIAVESKGIFRSIDGGATFNLLTNGLPSSDMNIISLSLCQSVPDVVYASIIRRSDFSLHGVFKTIDGGDSWEKKESAPQAPCSPQFVGTCQGWYNNFISVAPYDPDHVYFGGVTMWQSLNGGTSWIEKDRLICVNCNLPPQCTMYGDHHDFGFSPHDPDFLISMNDGGVARSLDGGNCFEDVNHQLATGQFISASASRVNPDIIIGGLQDHGMQYADLSGGLDWKRWAWFDGADVEFHTSDPDVFYGTWIDGTYWKFRRGAQTLANAINFGMNLTENTGAYYAPLAVHPTNGNILLGATQQKLYRSSNGGSSWTPVLSTSVISDIKFSEADPNIAYAVAWNNSAWNFYRSENGGLDWIQTISAPGWRVTDLKTSGKNALTVYATRNSVNSNVPHIYKSIDGGDTWVGIQGDMPDIITNCLAVDLFDDDIIYCGTDLGTFVTQNGGINWCPFNDGMPITYVYDLEFNPSDTSMIAATMGRGVWRTYFESTTSTEEVDMDLGVKVYPNPISNDIQIEFGYNLNERVELRLIDHLGQLKEVIFNESFNGRLLQTRINNSVRDGNYFLEIRLREKRLVKPIVLFRDH